MRRILARGQNRSTSLSRYFCHGLLAIALLLPSLAFAQNALRLNASAVELYEAGVWNQAIEQFRGALRLDPGNDVIRENLSNAYRAYAGDLARESDYASAIKHLEAALLLSPDDEQPLLQIGAYYLREGRVGDAIFRLEEAIELSPEDVDGHFLLGEAYYRDNDVNAALRQWEWVNRIEPDKPGLAERLESARREEAVEANFSGRTSRHFNVTYNREAEGRLVSEVLQLLERAYVEIGRTLGHTYPPAPIQVTLYTSEGFTQSTRMSAHVGAVYDGSKIRCPVIDAEGNRLPKAELRRRLYHEYVHVVVHDIAKGEIPWWLNEGLAEALTGDLTQRDRDFLAQANRHDALFSLETLTEGQLDRLSADELYLAYKQSHATVEYLKGRFGARRIPPLLRAIASGENPETAIRRTFRQSYKTLELAVDNFIEKG